MIRVSVSALDGFAKYLDPEFEWMDLDRVLDQLICELVPSDDMLMGSGFHELIRLGPQAKADHRLGCYMIKTDDGLVRVPFGYAGYAFEWHLEHPAAVYEIPGSKIYRVGSQEVRVGFRVDAMEGTALHDFKVSRGIKDLWTFDRSYQYRFYLDAMGADKFTYWVYTRRGRSGSEYMTVQDFDLYAYEGMQRDLDNLLYQFVHFLDLQNITKYFDGRIQKPGGRFAPGEKDQNGLQESTQFRNTGPGA